MLTHQSAMNINERSAKGAQRVMGRRKEVSAALSFSSFPSPIARFSLGHAARESSPDGFLYLRVCSSQTGHFCWWFQCIIFKIIETLILNANMANIKQLFSFLKSYRDFREMSPRNLNCSTYCKLQNRPWIRLTHQKD